MTLKLLIKDRTVFHEAYELIHCDNPEAKIENQENSQASQDENLLTGVGVNPSTKYQQRWGDAEDTTPIINIDSTVGNKEPGQQTGSKWNKRYSKILVL